LTEVFYLVFLLQSVLDLNYTNKLKLEPELIPCKECKILVHTQAHESESESQLKAA